MTPRFMLKDVLGRQLAHLLKDPARGAPVDDVQRGILLTALGFTPAALETHTADDGYLIGNEDTVYLFNGEPPTWSCQAVMATEKILKAVSGLLERDLVTVPFINKKDAMVVISRRYQQGKTAPLQLQVTTLGAYLALADGLTVSSKNFLPHKGVRDVLRAWEFRRNDDGSANWHPEWRQANLSGIDLSHEDLRDVDFTGANLSNANFHGAVMVRTVLVDANIDGADFSGASIGPSTLDGSYGTADLTNVSRVGKPVVPDPEIPDMDNAGPAARDTSPSPEA